MGDCDCGLQELSEGAAAVQRSRLEELVWLGPTGLGYG